MQHPIVRHDPVLLLDPQTDRAAQLAMQLESSGFPTRIEESAAAARSAIERDDFATLIVMADLDDNACLEWLDTLRRIATRCWIMVVSSRFDPETRDLVYRHGGDACIVAPLSINELIERLTALQRHSRPLL